MEDPNMSSEEVVNEPQRVSTRSYTVWVYCALIITTISLSLLLLVVILARKNLRQRVFNQLLVSMAFGGVIFNLFVRPGTIQNEDNTYEMNKGYCGIYLLLQQVEGYFMPLMFWMMSIERLIALREPENYFKKITKSATAALVAVPWCFAVALAVLTTFILGNEIITRYSPYPDYFDEMAHQAHFQCMVMYSRETGMASAILMFIFSALIPALALFASGLALVIVYFRRRNVKVCDAEGETFVSGGSIIFCILLNLSALIIIIMNLAYFILGFFPSYWAWSFVELISAILALSLLPGVRRIVGVICCCCIKPNDEKQALLGVPKETQTPKMSVQSE